MRILNGGRAAWLHHFRHDESKKAQGEQAPAEDKDFGYEEIPELLTTDG